MKVGIVGLGIMGGALADRLLSRGIQVAVYNRTAQKAEPFLGRGATWATSPAALAAQVDIVISLVTDPNAVAEIVYGAGGILGALGPETVHCDMSTVAPAWSAKVSAEYVAAGKRFVQAPVLGSKRQIADGSLLVFGGGDEESIGRCRPVWDHFASHIWTVGTAEQAASTKIACNMMIGHMILGLGQSLVFARKNGVDPAILLDIIQSSNLASAMYGSKGKTLLARNFAANFVVDNMLKDLNLAIEQGLRSKTPLPFTALARELFVAASSNGYGGDDYSAVVKVLEELAGTTLG